MIKKKNSKWQVYSKYGIIICSVESVDSKLKNQFNFILNFTHKLIMKLLKVQASH